MSFTFAAVLFDLDGVILDTTACHYRIWTDWARTFGKTPTQAELVATNGVRATETIRLWLGNAAATANIDAIAQELSELITKDLQSGTMPAVPGVQAYVEALKNAGIPRAVATSATTANAWLSLNCVKLADSFDEVITADQVTRGKPHPEPYLKAAEKLGVSAKDCVVFEDSLSGLRAAQAAGAKRAALTTTFPLETLQAEKPDWLLPDFCNLPPVLKV